ncbi:unnamed protein product [Closterium sp. NIES-65]|nr:unnamed protein product [Closterium sp. NIES-65]
MNYGSFAPLPPALPAPTSHARVLVLLCRRGVVTGRHRDSEGSGGEGDEAGGGGRKVRQQVTERDLFGESSEEEEDEEGRDAGRKQRKASRSPQGTPLAPMLQFRTTPSANACCCRIVTHTCLAFSAPANHLPSAFLTQQRHEYEPEEAGGREALRKSVLWLMQFRSTAPTTPHARCRGIFTCLLCPCYPPLFPLFSTFHPFPSSQSAAAWQRHGYESEEGEQRHERGGYDEEGRWDEEGGERRRARERPKGPPLDLDLSLFDPPAPPDKVMCMCVHSSCLATQEASLRARSLSLSSTPLLHPTGRVAPHRVWWAVGIQAATFDPHCLSLPLIAPPLSLPDGDGDGEQHSGHSSSPLRPRHMVMVMASNIVGIQAAPFDLDTYEEGGPQNLIRWRHVRRPDGTMGVSAAWGEWVQHGVESNARMVRWSDGSLHLLLGAEVLATDIKSMQHDKAHLFVRHPKQGVVQGQGQLLEKMRFRPFDTHSLIHKKLTLGLDSKYRKGKELKSIVTTGDPEKEKEERERVSGVWCGGLSLALGLDSKYRKGKELKSIVTTGDPEKEKEERERSIQQQIRTKETLRQEQEKRARKYSNQPQQRAARDREQQRYGGGYRQQVCGVPTGAVSFLHLSLSLALLPDPSTPPCCPTPSFLPAAQPLHSSLLPNPFIPPCCPTPSLLSAICTLYGHWSACSFHATLLSPPPLKSCLPHQPSPSHGHRPAKAASPQAEEAASPQPFWCAISTLQVLIVPPFPTPYPLFHPSSHTSPLPPMTIAPPIDPLPLASFILPAPSPPPTSVRPPTTIGPPRLQRLQAEEAGIVMRRSLKGTGGEGGMMRAGGAGAGDWRSLMMRGMGGEVGRGGGEGGRNRGGMRRIGWRSGRRAGRRQRGGGREWWRAMRMSRWYGVGDAVPGAMAGGMAGAMAGAMAGGVRGGAVEEESSGER